MKTIFLSIIILVTISCRTNSQNSDVKIIVGSKEKPSANEATATFGEGCFWHSEIIFQCLVGVRDAVSGYAGGTAVNPNYEKVSEGTTGHAETVQVYYDPSVISFETLVKAFFASHNPTTLNRQGNDEGSQYRSIAFYRTEKEKQILEEEIKKINESKMYADKVVTEVKPFTIFYPAEDYHQEFVYKNPDNPYVQSVSIPDYIAFKKRFKGNFK